MKEHWENIYATKKDTEVSWYEEAPSTSLRLIRELPISKNANLIDIGGGNSNLADALLTYGHKYLDVLDISQNALARTQKKLGIHSRRVDWHQRDVLDFSSIRKYDIWHDRAVFHFLTNENDRQAYKRNLVNHLNPKAYFILATFSQQGPEKCSGLPIKQYNETALRDIFQDQFSLIQSFEEDHQTPFNTTQNFIYSVWQKKK